MQDFRKLRVWQLAHELTLEIERALPTSACRRLPGFRSQVLRAAMSIASNIAEGCGKRTPQEFHRYLEMAISSLFEVESQLLFGRDAKVLPEVKHTYLEQRTTTLRRMLISLMQRVLAASAPD